MSKTRSIFIFALALIFASCGEKATSESLAKQGEQSNGLSGSIKIDGSSTVYPITEAIAEEFREVHPKVKTTVGVSGTGGGFKKFSRGETDISDASRPIKPKEIRA